MAVVSVVIGLLCAAIMGFAINSGATCMVAAVSEWAAHRRATRLRAMLEAGLWVSGGLLLAECWHMAVLRPAAFGIGPALVLGGALLGIGAWINGGCVFGAIARLGAGELSFVLTPIGYFLGAAALVPVFAPPPQVQAMRLDPALLWPLACLFAVFALWRGWRVIARLDWQAHRSGHWAPHEATIMIGLAFLAMFLTVGAWTYPDLLADLAAGRTGGLLLRSMLFLALLAGAAAGGIRAGKWRGLRLERVQALRCITGGAIMAAGAALIPGGNDGLLLVGLPLGYPHAWIALLAMVAAIYGMIRLCDTPAQLPVL